MGAKDRLEQAHKVMGITNKLSGELENIFNQWTKVRITDADLKKLIQMAMTPNRETLQHLQAGRQYEFSACFVDMCEAAFTYAMSDPTQQVETTKGSLFGAYNAVTGYYQNVRNYRDGEAKLKSILYGGTAQLRTQKAFHLCEAFQKLGGSALHLN
jgi:hypothetical protein